MVQTSALFFLALGGANAFRTSLPTQRSFVLGTSPEDIASLPGVGPETGNKIVSRLSFFHSDTNCVISLIPLSWRNGLLLSTFERRSLPMAVLRCLPRWAGSGLVSLELSTLMM